GRCRPRTIPTPLRLYSVGHALFSLTVGNRIGRRAVWSWTCSPSPDGGNLGTDEELARFERAILPHLDAAYNLARWLTRNDHDAEDVVQEACLRAHQFFGGFQGADGRAWLLTVVRNTCYTWLERNRPRTPVIAFDEHKHGSADPGASPPSLALRGEDQQL